MSREAFEALVCSPEFPIYRGAVWREFGVKWNVVTGQYLNSDVQAACIAWQARQPEIDALTAQLARLRVSLNSIASWPEGVAVTSSFDEPCSAKLARDALAEFPEASK